MTLPYLVRLICLSLACFFAVNFAASLLLRWLSPRALRLAERKSPKDAARLLLALRLLPAGFAMFCVVALCVPSYLWLEPNAVNEAAGWVCILSAILGGALWAVAFSRSTVAVARSLKFGRESAAAGRPLATDDAPVPVIVVPDAGRLVALSGIFRPRVIASSEVVDALDADQFAVALRHELAHALSRDNFKRLLILLSPAFFLRDLEIAWERFSEWAADDLATAGDSESAVTLASALVAVARLRPSAATPLLATTLVAENADVNAALAARVDRMLAEPSQQEAAGKLTLILLIGIGSLVALSPIALPSVHRLLESLMD